jgi:hypothetical protein
MTSGTIGMIVAAALIIEISASSVLRQDPSMAGTAVVGASGRHRQLRQLGIETFRWVGSFGASLGAHFNALTTSGRFGYFCTADTPGTLFKVRLSNMTKVKQASVPGSSWMNKATNDGIFIYISQNPQFGTDLAVLWKIKMSDLSVVNQFSLGSSVSGGILDLLSDDLFAYIGIDVSPGLVVKVRTSDMTEQGRVTLTNSELRISCSVRVGSFGYYGSAFPQKRIVKVDLSTMTEMDFISLNSTLACAITDGTHGYFGTTNQPAVVVKVHLETMKAIAFLATSSSATNTFSAAVIVGGMGYFATFQGILVVYQVDLSGSMSEVTSVMLDTPSAALGAATDGEYAYFGDNGSPPNIFQFAVPQPTPGPPPTPAPTTLAPAPPSAVKPFLNIATFQSSNSSTSRFGALVTDGTFGYFATHNSPGVMFKVNLTTMQSVMAATIVNSSDMFRGVTDGTFAYISSNDGLSSGLSATLIKVRLSDLSVASDGVFRLPNGDGNSVDLTTDRTFAYVATEVAPARVVKVRMSDMTEQGRVALTKSQTTVSCSVRVGRFAYYGSSTNQPMIVKVDLGAMAELNFITVEASITSSPFLCATTDGNFGYFASFQHPSVIVKVQLATMSVVASSPPEADTIGTFTVAFTDGTFGYFAASFNNGSDFHVEVHQFNLSTMNKTATVSLGNSNAFGATTDGTYAYVGDMAAPPNVFKLQLSVPVPPQLLDSITGGGGDGGGGPSSNSGSSVVVGVSVGVGGGLIAIMAGAGLFWFCWCRARAAVVDVVEQEQSRALNGVESGKKSSTGGSSSNPTTIPTPVTGTAVKSPAGVDALAKFAGYTKLNLVGRGANGSVYRCSTISGKLFALKEMLLPTNQASGLVDLIEKEVSLVTSLDHPNLVKYYASSIDLEKGIANIFMEFVPNGSLGSVVRQMPEPMDEALASKYLRQVLLGLSYMHEKGVMHRDIKCDNVLLASDGSAKITDFGAARIVESSDTIRGAQTMIGTPYFMAPEMLLGGGDDEDGMLLYGKRADIWSLGIMTLELLEKGSIPWPNMQNLGMLILHISTDGSLPIVPARLSAEARDFVSKCCERSPSLRWRASELLNHPWIVMHAPSDLEPRESFSVS